jgi:hypothetical protein
MLTVIHMGLLNIIRRMALREKLSVREISMASCAGVIDPS